MNKKEDLIVNIDKTLKSLKEKSFKVFFFVIDTKGTPNGNTQYTYWMAKRLIDLGYTVEMLYQEEDFVGVSEWLGDEYADLPHSCIEKTSIKISTADFLIIPEIFANVMNQTKDLPCKRIVLCQNANYISEFIPIGVSWDNYNIRNVITTTEEQKKDIKNLFPNISVDVIHPEIPSYFRDDGMPKKLMVSVISKDQTVVNKIIKQFHWKFPIYRWITFTDPRGLSKEAFADTLRESAITVWVDDETYFGYVPNEAVKSGSLLIGKIPNVIPEWMYNEEGTALNNAGLWFSDMRDVQKLISGAIQWVMNDAIPDVIYSDMEKLKDKYTTEDRVKEIDSVFGQYVTDRINEIETIKNNVIQKERKGNE